MAKLINIYGAPGAGKSTSAAGLFYDMKKHHYKVELAYEWIKFKVYEGTPYPFNDQIYAFAKQNKQIKQLESSVDYIITDSPLLMSIYYGQNEPDSFKQLVLDCYDQYENYNFVVKRNHPYSEYGRNQTEEESNKIHEEIVKILNSNSIPYVLIDSNDCINEIKKVMKL